MNAEQRQVTAVRVILQHNQNKKAALSQGNRAMFKSRQASKARLQSSEHTGKKHGHSRSFKVTCFGVSRKVIKY